MSATCRGSDSRLPLAACGHLPGRTGPVCPQPPVGGEFPTCHLPARLHIPSRHRRAHHRNVFFCTIPPVNRSMRPNVGRSGWHEGNILLVRLIPLNISYFTISHKINQPFLHYFLCSRRCAFSVRAQGRYASTTVRRGMPGTSDRLFSSRRRTLSKWGRHSSSGASTSKPNASVR